MDILQRIVQERRLVLEDEINKHAELQSRVNKWDFARAVSQTAPAVIAEIKYASPSKGNFGVTFSPDELAKLYEQGGAAALSVLACETHFAGSPEYVLRVKEATQIPVLWKDFVFDYRQINMAARCGADAILLICAVLGEEIGEFITASQEAGLQPVVEVYNEDEAALANRAGAKIILINNRNLRDFKVDLEVSKSLAQLFSPDILVISASGIKDRSDIDYLRHAGLKAFLVGESVACAPHPDQAVRKLISL